MNTEEIKKEFDAFLEDFSLDGKILKDVPASIYHAEKRFISKHMLDILADSPEKYKFALEHEEPESDNAALRFGEAFHTFILEPQKFEERYVQMPAEIKIRRGKAWDEFKEASAGKEILSAEEFEKLNGMKASILANEYAKTLLFDAEGDAELTVLWRSDACDGEACKARLDRVVKEHKIIVDLKTTANASPESFAKSVANYRYDVQGAFYIDALKAASKTDAWRFAIVAIEKEAPYAVAVYFLDEWEHIGRATYLRDMESLFECKIIDSWDGYSVPHDILPVPAWVGSTRKLQEVEHE